MAYYDNYDEKQLKAIIESCEASRDIIYNSNDDTTIGYYKDLVRFYKHYIKQKLDEGEYEEAKELMDELAEIEEFKDYDGLLVLSQNNGMGFTCNKYQDDWEVAKWVAENIAPEDDDAMPKIYGDHDRQKAFMEEVKQFMKGDC